MNLDELYALTKWVRTEIVDQEIQQKYQQLLNIVQQNSQPNQQKTPFENEKEKLIAALDSIYLGILTKDQLQFLASIKILPHLGKRGINNVEDILYKNSLDIATAVQKMQQIVTDLNEGIQKINQLSEGLKGCVDEDIFEAEDEVLIRVCFQGDASMNNVKDLKDWGSTWHLISHGIAMAHDASAEDVKVIGAAKGSVIIELSTIATIAGTVSGIILSALLVAEKILDLRKKAAEITILNLQAKGLEKQINDAADKEKSAGIDEIVKDQAKLLKLKKTADGEKINALEKSIKELVSFIEKGGEVDFVVPEEGYDDEDEVIEDDYTPIRDQVEEIRQLESQLRLIEDQSEEG